MEGIVTSRNNGGDDRLAALLSLMSSARTVSVEFFSPTPPDDGLPRASVMLELSGPDSFLAGKLMTPGFWKNFIEAIVNTVLENETLCKENEALLGKLSLYKDLDKEAKAIWPQEE